MYSASCVLINSVVDIGVTASCAQSVELTSPTDDIFAAKNLNRLSACFNHFSFSFFAKQSFSFLFVLQATFSISF